MVRRLLILVISVSFLTFFSLFSPAAEPLPRFTEEREAAAWVFVRKHSGELIPFLEELKRGNRLVYETKIRELFHFSEYLAELQDDPKRYDLELRTWKAENRALIVVAKWTMAKEEDRPGFEDQLNALARELIELEAQALEHRVESLSVELAATKDELGKLRDNFDRLVKERVELLLDKSRRKRR